jgi:hypothetical protein
MCSYVPNVSYVVIKKGNTKIHEDDSTEIHKDNEILGWEVSGWEVQHITILNNLYNSLQHFTIQQSPKCSYVTIVSCVVQKKLPHQQF